MGWKWSADRQRPILQFGKREDVWDLFYNKIGSEDLLLVFCNKNCVADNGLWVWNEEKASSLLGWMDESFGLCVFFKLKLCSWICTKALTVKPFVMQASDMSLKKKNQRVGWGESSSKVALSKEIKQKSCKNFKLQLKNSISNPIQLHLPCVLREKIKWKI